MTGSTHRETLVEALLNGLEAERHTRAQLLRTIVDALESDVGLEAAAVAARAILTELAALSDVALAERIEALRNLVRTLSGPAPAASVEATPARREHLHAPSAASAT